MTPFGRIRRGVLGAAGAVLSVVASVATPSGAALAAEVRPGRILSLDQCADQYVLALAPQAELALSPRADDADSWMREAARGRRQLRPSLEAATVFRPDAVVRYWGGDMKLLAALEARGVRVITIPDVTDFDGVRANIETVAAALGREAAGRALIADMEANLDAAGRGGPRGGAVYLTPGGFTAGTGTLIDAVLKAAGYENLSRAPGYGFFSVERIVLEPPARFVLGFFDLARLEWRGPGRHPVVARASRGRVAARLPGAALTCPAWFAADAAAQLARAEDQ